MARLACVQYSPNFPAYPSGHAVIGTAGLRVAQHLLKLSTDDCFTFQSAEFDGMAKARGESEARPKMTRKLTVEQAIEENRDSRVWIGALLFIQGCCSQTRTAVASFSKRTAHAS